jgi:uncharacterized membrane protein YjgN (DUF898 family)
MEIISNTPKKINFTGNGNSLFGIMIVNLLLCIVTLGLYYPWARAKKLQYLYGETEFENSRFTFHGTGKEMFVGFVKTIVLLGIIIGVYIYALSTQNPVMMIIGVLFYVLSIFLLTPLAIHGSMRYRLSRMSWRGIHFGYRGDKWKLIGLFLKGIILSIFTLYIYLPWFSISIRKYIIGNIRFGNVSFKYTGEGFGLLKINIKGFFFTVFTFGIYGFWWVKDIYNYYIENIVLVQDEMEYKISSEITGRKVFSLMVVNYFIVLFTLGLGMPWVIIRNMNFIYSNSLIDGNFDPNLIIQTEESYTDAMGDDMMDFFDINIA